MLTSSATVCLFASGFQRFQLYTSHISIIEILYVDEIYECVRVLVRVCAMDIS